MPQCLCQCFLCRLVSLLDWTNRQFRLCWLWGRPLIRLGNPLPSLLQWTWRTARCWKRVYRDVRLDSRHTMDITSKMEIRPWAYSFITHGSWSLLARRGRLISYTAPQRFGWISSAKNKRTRSLMSLYEYRTTPHDTRHGQYPILPNYITNLVRRIFLYRGPDMWRKLADAVTKVPGSLRAFKNVLTRHLHAQCR